MGCTDNGYALVASKEECELAARKLRTVDSDSTPDLTVNSDVYSDSWSGEPKGCFKYSQSSLYFNTRSSSSVSCSSSKPCVCRTSAFDSGAYAFVTSAGECVGKHITSEAECKGAAEILDPSSVYRYAEASSSEPRGCYRYESSKDVYFNYHTKNDPGYERPGYTQKSICRTSSFHRPDHNWHDTGARVTCADASMAAIGNADDCRKAANKLHFVYRSANNYGSNYPSGCFRHYDSVYFNTGDGANAWWSSGTRSSICGVRV